MATILALLSILILIVIIMSIKYIKWQQVRDIELLEEIPEEVKQHYSIIYTPESKYYHFLYKNKPGKRFVSGYKFTGEIEETVYCKSMNGIKQQIYKHYLKHTAPAKVYTISGKEIIQTK